MVCIPHTHFALSRISQVIGILHGKLKYLKIISVPCVTLGRVENLVGSVLLHTWIAALLTFLLLICYRIEAITALNY